MTLSAPRYFMHAGPVAFTGGRAGGMHYPRQAGQSVRMTPHLGRGTVPLVAAVAAVAIAAALVVVALVGAARGGNPGPGAATRQISVTAGSVTAIDLQGVPGQVRIVGAATGQVTVTGQLHWTGPHAVVASRTDRGHVLRLSYRCAAASPCTGNYLLVVPRRTAVVLRQPAGHVIISGLASSLRIMAGSVDVSATALRCPALAAVITSGHLSATFDTAPQRVSITLTSAQATLRLPGMVSYAVSSQVTSGYVHVGIPQASGAARTVTARIDSGELELLPTELAR
jgi:hypothetical protein